MDFVKWGLVLSFCLFSAVILSLVIYILLPFIMDALTGQSGVCNYYGYEIAPPPINAAMYNLCTTAKSFLGATGMILLVLSSPVIFVSNALASFEIFPANTTGGVKVTWLAIIWVIAPLGGIIYLWRGRHNFRPSP